ncbi:leucine-rich repeat-containing protein 74A-like [Trichoplusia ni]|uniref:Leucine-rich repeat-containing protein 74A-like n=1 Tax=Trichoplusia ni TaxID=7111 RepID=A0A7E5V8W4_TRINI|nr:leucine-rich repeat-containing protein 74A-like [Trichoplusia ni]
MSDDESEQDKPIEFIYVGPEDRSSEEEPPMSEWSSLEVPIEEENQKRLLFSEGQYSPGSGEICTQYFFISESSVYSHAYYNYPAVTDPGIKEALNEPERPIIYPDDGQALYLSLCTEMNICPVRMFYNNLLNSEINISYYGVDPRGVRAMAKALQFNKNVTYFNLSGNFLNDDACYHLGRMIHSNITIRELNLDGCRICGSGMLRLGDSLRTNNSLVILNLARNNLEDIGGIHFAHQIFKGAMVKQVNLSHNNLGRKTAMAFADVWEWKNRFTHLDLSWNSFFHAPSTVKMLDSLSLSHDLEELNLSYNALEGERIANAIKNLFVIPTLSFLDLSHNRLQNEAIDIIALSLFQAKKLHTLNLSFNPLSPQDAFNVLQKMLRPKVKINNLLMENVCVEKPFVDLLARVKKMKSRKHFVCKFDVVLGNWEVEEPDARSLVLKRAQYLGKAAKRNKVDTALYFMALAKELPKPVPTKELVDRLDADHVALDEDLVDALSFAFPGPKTPKWRTISLNLITEYISRLWPNKKLPPTPPPELEPEPEPVVEEVKPVRKK